MNHDAPPPTPMDERHECDHRCAQLGMRASLDRRAFMQMTIGGALGMMIRPGLPELLAGAPGHLANEKAVIWLWMHGGMSQIDSVDPKFDSRYAGPFKQIRTNLPGVHFTDQIPLLARQMDKMSIIRSVTSPETEHNRAQFFANTGYRATGTLDNPSLGAMVSHELGDVPMQRANREGLPGFVSIGHEAWGPGFLGVEHSPFIVWDPNRNPDNLGLPAGVSDEQLNRRLAMLKSFEAGNVTTGGTKYASDLAQSRAEAKRFMTSKNVDAFKLDDEPSELRDAYGRNNFGQGCLLARRLVEAGVRFVQVHQGGWDTHSNNFPAHERLLGVLDPGMSTLLTDLQNRRMLDNTLVICMGEFGRTPRINAAAGRDHHPRAWSIMMAGGGVAAGQIYGESSPDGMTVKDKPVTIPDFFATVCQLIGMDADQEFIAAAGRPIKLVDKGTPISDLIATPQAVARAG